MVILLLLLLLPFVCTTRLLLLLPLLRNFVIIVDKPGRYGNAIKVARANLRNVKDATSLSSTIVLICNKERERQRDRATEREQLIRIR
jgi:RNA binding exosome subunit